MVVAVAGAPSAADVVMRRPLLTISACKSLLTLLSPTFAAIMSGAIAAEPAGTGKPVATAYAPAPKEYVDTLVKV